MIALRLAGALLATSLVGCGPPPKDPALAAYEAFVASLRGRDPVRVFALLAPDSQRILLRRLGLPEGASGEAVRAVLGVRPGWGFELDLPQQARLEEATLRADRKLVLGPLDGVERRIPVLQVDGVWRVDLFAAQAVTAAGRQGD